MEYGAGITAAVTASFIDLVTARIKEVLTSEGSIQKILAYIQQTSGKMIRPTLASLVFQLCGGESEAALLDAAAGIELIHMASLIHDDIIDRSDLRRDAFTVQKQFGVEAAVLAGDFLFARAFNLFTNSEPRQVLAVMTDVISQMCIGEIQQLMDPVVKEADYWQYIYQKTACFIEGACRVGAVAARTAELREVELLSKFGLALGYAYQLTDDLLDYTAEPKTTGKTPGNDFQQGIWTLPIIRGVESGVIPANWHQELSFTEARKLLEQHGIFQEIQRDTDFYIRQAQAILLSFPDHPARTKLLELAEFIGTRQH
ncbi:MAG TPA: polyprenyl synthetase family protein [Firmicutes bacterium]|jgi:heptaprenyl diphosphate synthase|nr:polyprenyl synthetase family protein [Bacillota bacterium]